MGMASVRKPVGGPVLLVLTVYLLSLTWAQTGENTAVAKLCQAQETCDKCIGASQLCAWCTQDGFDKDNTARCDLYSNLISKQCDPSFIMNPDNKVKFTENKTLQDSDKIKDAVQIRPQKVTLKIRPNKPASFQVTFRQAENYPVDLYYLMDLSNSMADDKDNLAQLGVLIAKNMSAITRDFQLGFGSFVDKVTMPYVSTIKSKLETPCKGCAAPYGFKHNLVLNPDPSRFRSNVMAAPISGNLDSPEGGFDAILQAIVCGKKIGWREPSRKMMLFSTDAGFHFAGDGKLGGIVKPNDGQCHLDPQGIYTESINQDYPSISQLAAKISEEKVNIIFAVTKNQFPTYQRLSKYIEGSVAGVLANDSSNIVQLVQENYNKITSKVELNTENAEGITVTIKSRCKNTGGDMKVTNVCEGLKIGDNVTFDVSVEIKECPAGQKRRTFSIYPVGLTEKLTVRLDLICQCDCQKQGIANSPNCNGTGTYECGSCACPKGRYGKFCQCDGSEVSSEESDARCIRGNTTQICMGRGECVCGECKCFARATNSDKKFSGKFCECDDYSCALDGRKLCGGPEQGTCQCGKCTCKTGFEGDACQCPVGNNACIAPSSQLECNEHGTCSCGKCKCDPKYRGPTCEECPTCLGRCADNRDCVQCKAFSTGPKTVDQCKNQCQEIIMVNEAKVEHPNMTLCQFKDEDDCTFYFTYEYISATDLLIKAQRTKVCPEGVNILAIVLGVIGGIVAVGLALLLIWKLLTTIHDRREFAKFEKERKNAKWDTGENPIYKQATSTFKNPTYAGKQ